MALFETLGDLYGHKCGFTMPQLGDNVPVGTCKVQANCCCCHFSSLTSQSTAMVM